LQIFRACIGNIATQKGSDSRISPSADLFRENGKVKHAAHGNAAERIASGVGKYSGRQITPKS
jgi:hypothetical protein